MRNTTIWYPFQILYVLILIVGWHATGALAQQSTKIPTNAIPPLVQFGGVLADVNGKPLTGTLGVTFAVYKDQQGGAPLWVETHNVQSNKTGHFSVMLGAATATGLPGDLFGSGEARWIGVRAQGQEEQPRVMLVSVPYAMKAGDATTLGGLPPSAFVLSGTSSTGNSISTGVAPSTSDINALSGTGKKNYLPIWTTTTALGSSALFQSGKGSQAPVGFNTTTPKSMLDVNGSGTIRGLFTLPSTGTATASSGFTSQPQDFTASVFNSGTNTAVPQTFQWQAEPVGNNTGNATGSFNLLFGQGAGKPAETGLSIASTGQITFANGQTFPGTGNGTITGVTAGTDLTGGGTSGNVTLNLDTTKVPQLASSNSFSGEVGIGAPANANSWAPLALGSANSFGTWLTLANTSAGGHTWNILSAGAGNAEGAGNLGITDLTGKSTIFLEGNVNATSLTTTGPITGSIFNSNTGYQLGGNLFATGSPSLANAFTGYSGNTSTTGAQNTGNGAGALIRNTSGSVNMADGSSALADNTTGYANTATGTYALQGNTTGNANTAVGYGALYLNQTGSYNTALGVDAGPDSKSNNLTNATAIGAFSQVTESNALVLGSIAGVNGGSANALVGIGTTAPTQSLEVDLGNALVRGTNNFQKDGDTANLFLGDTNNFIQATHGTGLTLGTFQAPAAVRISQYSGFVGIGTSSPTNRLTLGQGTGAAVGDGWNTYSSRRWKTHIQTLDDALAKVEHLRGVSYELKESGKHEIGVIAEEVGQVVPEVVSYEDNGKDARSVDYSRLTALLIEAVKQQQRQIQTQQGQIRAQQQQILRLNNQVGVLEAASRVGGGARPANAAIASGETASARSNEQLLRAVRQQLHQLRSKDTRLEDRLTRLERDLKGLNSQTTTVALAEAQK